MQVLATAFQLRICTNKTCKRQGSPQASDHAAAGPLRWPGAAGTAAPSAAVAAPAAAASGCRRDTSVEGRCGLPTLLPTCAIQLFYQSQIAQFAKDLGLPSVDVQTCGCLGE